MRAARIQDMKMEDTFDRLMQASGLPRNESRRLMSLVTGKAQTWLMAHGDDTADADVAARFAMLAGRRRNGEPLAYLLGEQEFHGHRFAVSPAVLIPRADTETLVEVACERLESRASAHRNDSPPMQTGMDHAPLRLLDLGTGSGIIAITLALLHPDAEVHAVERSADALAMARHNAATLGAINICWHHGSWWDALQAGEGIREKPDSCTAPDMLNKRHSETSDAQRLSHAGTTPPPSGISSAETPDTPLGRTSTESAAFTPSRQPPQQQSTETVNVSCPESVSIAPRFDLIVSNPPYIAAADHHLQQGDLRFEPQQALASGADGLDDLRIIIAGAPAHLVPGGWLLLEHGYDQQDAVQALLKAAGLEQVFTRRDLAGQPRVSGGVFVGTPGQR